MEPSLGPTAALTTGMSNKHACGEIRTPVGCTCTRQCADLRESYGIELHLRRAAERRSYRVLPHRRRPTGQRSAGGKCGGRCALEERGARAGLLCRWLWVVDFFLGLLPPTRCNQVGER
jgi:hypothetical protein